MKSPLSTKSKRQSDLDTDLEHSKSLRQEQSRAVVKSGSRTSEQNFFISKDTARRSTFKFKG